MSPAQWLVSSSVPQAPLSALFVSFLVYSFAGWLWESTLCGLMNRGRFTNSGFLLGPVCPIYGTGALACWLMLREIPDPIALFLVSGLVCCLIEYVVGAALECMTGARFWDYEDKPLNIGGRVCLYGFVLFGAGSVAICKVVQPALLGLLGLVDGLVLFALAAVCALALAADWVLAWASWRNLSLRLEELRAQMAGRLEGQMEQASERLLDRLGDEAVESLGETYVRTRDASAQLLGRLSGAVRRMPERAPEAPEWLQDASEALLSRLSGRDLRFFDAFPRLKIPRYEEVIRVTRLRERISRRRLRRR